MNFIDSISGWFNWGSAITVAITLITLIWGAWVGLKTSDSGMFEVKFESTGMPTVVLKGLPPSEGEGEGDRDKITVKEPKAFEVTALANYYNQALSRAKISFWFSLVFATIGFGVIIFALISHDPTDLYATIMKVISGGVIDAVSSLFFVQSTNAQKQMGDFFEKLRLDRLITEAQVMIREIEQPERRDQLRAQLILRFAGIDKLLEGASVPNAVST